MAAGWPCNRRQAVANYRRTRAVTRREPAVKGPVARCDDETCGIKARGSSHIVSLRHEHFDAAEVREFLDREHRVNASSRGGGIRVSLNGYNDSPDLLELTGALQGFARSPS